MKRMMVLLMAAVLGLGLAAGSSAETAVADAAQATRSPILIAYFSVPEAVDTVDAVAGASIVVRDGEKLGNAEYVARLIQETVGGDLFRIETVEAYPLEHDPLVGCSRAAGIGRPCGKL